MCILFDIIRPERCSAFHKGQISNVINQQTELCEAVAPELIFKRHLAIELASSSDMPDIKLMVILLLYIDTLSVCH